MDRISRGFFRGHDENGEPAPTATGRPIPDPRLLLRYRGGLHPHFESLPLVHQIALALAHSDLAVSVQRMVFPALRKNAACRPRKSIQAPGWRISSRNHLNRQYTTDGPAVM